ncbi:serine/threonine-protein kinase [Nocardia sp. NBC_01327]|uniref:serine/threonine-protein kinase n=1 Tax=Nocardia sp. NBC_01327 TaxID=2903593 RepID=UPI002E0F2EEE|nr:serine/threonine protein kinase [Nocardia sp. NBC_01327]
MVFRYPAPVTERARPIVGPDYLVAGRYRLQSKLGGGGMGAVWLAKDRLLNRDVAIKQVLTTAGLNEHEAQEVRRRIMHEGRVAAKLSHEHAIAVYDVELENGEPWLVMEYLPSRSVAKAISLTNALSPIEVAQIGAQVADALATAHAAGIVHRDIKPGNILVADRGDEVGMVKLSDFGISSAAGDADDVGDVITGTPAYLPPEVARGAQPTTASDVFSLGATLYTAMEGQPPYGFHDDSGVIVERAAMAQVIPPQRSGPLTSVLLHMMEPAPQRRPTMAEARNEILTAAFGPGTAPYILGAPVRTDDGTIPAWAARNSAAGLRSPHSSPLPRPQRTSATAAPAAPQQKSKGFDLSKLGPNAGPLAVAIGLLIGLLIIIVILVVL